MSWPPEHQAPTGAGGPLGRRAVLIGACVVAGLTLAGCGIHLQDDAPDVPLLPHRTPIGAETQLLSLLRSSRELAAACARWKTGAAQTVALAPALAGVHRQQAEVLAALLAAAHVPADVVAAATPPASPSATTTGSPSASAATSTTAPAPPRPVTTADIAALEQSALATTTELAHAPAALRPAVAAILAQRYAAAAVTSGTTPVIGPTPMTAAPTSSTTPTGSPSTGASPTGSTGADSSSSRWPEADLLAMLTATRSAVYGFEVVAAQGGRAGRALGLRTLATLADIQQEQVAGLASSPPPAAIGYRLPFPVATPAQAHKLAAQLTAGLRAAYGSHVSASAQGTGPFLDLVSWLGQVEVLGHDWGGAFVAFPGMTTP